MPGTLTTDQLDQVCEQLYGATWADLEPVARHAARESTLTVLNAISGAGATMLWPASDADAGPTFGVFVRWAAGQSRIGRTFASVDDDHPLADVPCMACTRRLATGEPVTLLVLGPSRDDEYRAKHAAGSWYNAAALPVHTACLGEAPAELHQTPDNPETTP